MSKQAERFHPGEYLADELEARGWTTRDCAARMGGDLAVDTLALDLLIACWQGGENRVRLGQEMADGLSRAFGTSAKLWMNLDAAYHAKESPTPNTPREER